MIDEQIRVEFLSPERWNRLSEVIGRIRPPRHILYALSGAECSAAYNIEGRMVELDPWRMRDGSLDGNGLLLAHLEADELQVWPAAGVAEWYAGVNLACTPQTDSEEYLHILRETPCRRFVQKHLPVRQPSWRELLPSPDEDGAQLKLIFREEYLYFDVLLLWRGQRLTLLTSLDRYPTGAWDATRSTWDFQAVCDMIKAEFAVPVTVDVLDWNKLR